jgi:cAMP factor
MKNKNMSILLAGSILLTTVAPVATNVYASSADNEIVQGYNQDAVLQNLEEKEEQLKDLKSEDLTSENQQNVDKLLDFVKDLEDQQSEKFGYYNARSFELPKYDNIPQRIELLTNIIKTITKSTKELNNKVRKAQTEIGLEITRAVVIVVNPASSQDKITGEITRLNETYERVLGYDDLTDEDAATVYVKAKLDKAIWDTRVKRDKEIIGKTSFEVYNTLNKNISKAVGVWLNPKATVAEVNQAIDDLQAALDEALSHVGENVEDAPEVETPEEVPSI